MFGGGFDLTRILQFITDLRYFISNLIRRSELADGGIISQKRVMSTRSKREQNHISLFTALYEHYSPIVNNAVISKFTTANPLMVVSKRFEMYQKFVRGYLLYFTIFKFRQTKLKIIFFRSTKISNILRGTPLGGTIIPADSYIFKSYI